MGTLLKTQEVKEELLARGIIPIVGKINDETLENATSAIERIRASNPQTRITFFIHTPGGDCQPALWLVDFIRMMRADITGVVCGKCYSAGITLLQACSTRSATPFSEFFPHMIYSLFRYSAFEEDAVGNFRREYERTTDLQKRMAELIAKRSRKSVEEVLELCRRGEERGDYRLTAEDALTFGLIDNIVDGKDWDFFQHNFETES